MRCRGQIRREWLTAAQAAHLEGTLFPRLAALQAIARARLARQGVACG